MIGRVRPAFFARITLAAMLAAPFALTAQAGPAAADTEPAKTAAPTAQEKEVADNLEKARRTLRFGIDSMVVSVINQSLANKDRRLAEDIKAVAGSLNAEVQKAVVDYFTALQDWSLHDKVVGMLDDFNDYQVEAVVKMLKYLQLEQKPATPELVDQLIQMSQSSKIDIQAAAVDTLTACGSDAQVDMLIKLFKKTGTATVVRSAILKAMGKYRTADTTKLLKDIVGDDGEEKTLRYDAITALGKQGQVENITLIKPSLTSKDVYERGAAINALSGFDNRLALPYYQQALRDELWRNRVAVLKIIREKKLNTLEEAVMFVAEDDPEKPVKAEALRTLAELDSAPGWDMMRRLFQEPKTADETRGMIAELLIGKNFLASREAIKKVFETEWLKEKSWLLDVICRELAAKKDLGAVEFYDKMLSNANFIIRIYGVRGIKETALLLYRPKLEAMLKEKPAAALKSTIEDALK